MKRRGRKRRRGDRELIELMKEIYDETVTIKIGKKLTQHIWATRRVKQSYPINLTLFTIYI